MFSSPLTNGGTGTEVAEEVEAPKEKPLNPVSAGGLSDAAGAEEEPKVNPPLGCARGGFVAVVVLALPKTSDAGAGIDVVVDTGAEAEDGVTNEKLGVVDVAVAGTEVAGALDVAPNVKEVVVDVDAAGTAEGTEAAAPKLKEGVVVVAGFTSAANDLGAESNPSDGVDTGVDVASLSLEVSALPKLIVGDVLAFDTSPPVSVVEVEEKLKDGTEAVVVGVVEDVAVLELPNENETAGLEASELSDLAVVVEAPNENPEGVAVVDVVVAGAIEVGAVEGAAPKVKPPADGAGVEFVVVPKEKPVVDVVEAGVADALAPNANPLLDANGVVVVDAEDAEEVTPAAHEGNFGGADTGGAVEGAVPRGLSQATHLVADLSFWTRHTSHFTVLGRFQIDSLNPFFSGSVVVLLGGAAGVREDAIEGLDCFGVVGLTSSTGEATVVEAVESTDSRDNLFLASKLLRRFSAVVLLHAGENVNLILLLLSSGSNSSTSRPAMGFGESKVNSLSTTRGGRGVGFA